MFEYKDFIPIHCCFFALLGPASPLKTIYKSLHSTKNLMNERKYKPPLTL